MSNDRVSIDYNADLNPLELLLAAVKRTGDFVAHGTLELPMPKVEVEGVGVLSFPVPAVQIAALIEQAVRAPFGRGEETILDTSVRKVWQLPPEKVRIGGKSWVASFEAIMTKVAVGLGCERAAVSAELYKLLIYDEGGFFSAHRDTEKAGGMFGTLVVVLPSAHRGGELGRPPRGARGRGGPERWRGFRGGVRGVLRGLRARGAAGRVGQPRLSGF